MHPIFNMTDSFGPDRSLSSGLLEVRACQCSMIDIACDSLLRNLSVGFTGCSVVILLTSTPDPWPHCVTQHSTMSTLSSLLLRVDKAHSHSSSHSEVLGHLPDQGISCLLSQLGRTANSRIRVGLLGGVKLVADRGQEGKNLMLSMINRCQTRSQLRMGLHSCRLSAHAEPRSQQFSFF